MNPTLTLIANLLQAFFAKNPLVEEIIPVLEQAGTAIANAKAGTAFSVSFPETIDGKTGTSTIGWTPA